MRRLEFKPAFSEALRREAWPVVVTGATGWLGQAVLEMLESALGDAFGARVTGFAGRHREIKLRSGRSVEMRALEEIDGLRLPPALVFHFAFLTREHAGLQDYVAANRKISALMQAFLERSGARGLFLPSSGAARSGTLETNPYGALKREDEALFGALCARLAIPAVRMRVFNLAGPFINKLDSYALACVIADIARGGPIRLRAVHPVWRGYAHVQDVLNIALGGLLNPQPRPVFDTAGERIEIGTLAARASMLLAGRALEIVRPDWQSGAADEYLGAPEMYRALAAALDVRLHALDAQILDTASYMGR
jgi:nucleoside-diphosphate-sugar epimerase